jgi:hypothetical protein
VTSLFLLRQLSKSTVKAVPDPLSLSLSVFTLLETSGLSLRLLLGVVSRLVLLGVGTPT